MAIKSFRDLGVWEDAMDLVEEVYLLTGKFPKQETYGLAGQMQRAVTSVPSNIAEGHTREYTLEYLHHVSYAQASLAELQTQLELALRLGYADKSSVLAADDHIAQIGRQLYALRNALKRKDPGPRPPTPGPQSRSDT